MINLLPTQVAKDAQLEKLTRRVGAVTTGVLVAYILLLAALAGSNWYLASRGVTVSGQVTGLESQVAALASVEAGLRQEADRLKLIQTALDRRVSLTSVAEALGGAEVTGWQYQPATAQLVVARAPSAAALEDYAEILATRFDQVSITQLKRLGHNLWQIELSVVGEGNESQL